MPPTWEEGGGRRERVVGDPSTEAEGLVCRGLVKRYGGVVALKSVDFEISPGSVVGLIGENGAGKSTLSGIVSGSVLPNEGQMWLDGTEYAPNEPADALASGVALIHQEIRTLPELSVAENIFLGRLPMLRGRVDREKLTTDAAEILALLGAQLDPLRPVRGLSMAAQQEIEIAKAIARQPRYVIFDEPSASLGGQETERVLERISAMRDQGVGVVYISHRLDEVREIADRIVCLRDGNRVATWDTGEVSTDALVNAMVGRELVHEHEDPPPHGDRVVLEVKNLSREHFFDGIDFELHEGEILGFAGLVGAGRTEVVRAIAGADRADSGTIEIDGEPQAITNTRAAIAAGIHMVPEDRKSQGLNLGRTAAENISLPWENDLTESGVIRWDTILRVAEKQRDAVDVRGEIGIPVLAMSGGNQQKVLLGKWLVKTPRVLILDEPTRGVDVGAKMTIYEILRSLASQGVSLIVVSSELEEVLGLAHRVLVMCNGRQRAILPREEATADTVMKFAVPATGRATEIDQKGPGLEAEARSQS
jgi:ribose transport system ATP-binding protein